MTEEKRGGEGDEASDADVDRLVRDAGASQPESGARPDGDAVVSYLTGSASTEESETVRSALATSPAFRGEVVDAIGEAEATESAETHAAFDAEPQAAIPATPPGYVGTVRTAAPLDAVARLFREVMRPWQIAALAAVVVAAVFVLSRRGPGPEAGWQVVTAANVEWAPENFAPFGLRGEESAEPPAGATEEEVALYALRRQITWRDGEYEFGKSRAAAPAAGPAIEVCFQDSRGACRSTVRVARPAGIAEGAPLHGWVAVQNAPGMLALRRFEVGGGRVALPWSEDLVGEGHLTLTYPAGANFAATSAVAFELR